MEDDPDDIWFKITKVPNNVIVIPDSDSDDDCEDQSFLKNLNLLCRKAQELAFKRAKEFLCEKSNTSTYSDKEQKFPYQLFKEIIDEFLKLNAETVNTHNKDVLWQNVIKWVVGIRCSFDFMDLINDDKWNYMLIELIKNYINYKSCLHTNFSPTLSTTERTKIDERIIDIIKTLGYVYSGRITYIIMTLLQVNIKAGNPLILDTIFRKYCLDRRQRQYTNKLVPYLGMVLCIRKWKLISPLKEDRTIINDSAKNILPNAVPPSNAENREFAWLCDLVHHALMRGDVGTKELLSKVIDLDEVCAKYFKLFKAMIQRNKDKSTAAKRKRCDSGYMAITIPMTGTSFDSVNNCNPDKNTKNDNVNNLMEEINKQLSFGPPVEDLPLPPATTDSDYIIFDNYPDTSLLHEDIDIPFDISTLSRAEFASDSLGEILPEPPTIILSDSPTEATEQATTIAIDLSEPLPASSVVETEAHNTNSTLNCSEIIKKPLNSIKATLESQENTKFSSTNCSATDIDGCIRDAQKPRIIFSTTKKYSTTRELEISNENQKCSDHNKTAISPQISTGTCFTNKSILIPEQRICNNIQKEPDNMTLPLKTILPSEDISGASITKLSENELVSNEIRNLFWGKDLGTEGNILFKEASKVTPKIHSTNQVLKTSKESQKLSDTRKTLPAKNTLTVQAPSRTCSTSKSEIIPEKMQIVSCYGKVPSEVKTFNGNFCTIRAANSEIKKLPESNKTPPLIVTSSPKLTRSTPRICSTNEKQLLCKKISSENISEGLQSVTNNEKEVLELSSNTESKLEAPRSSSKSSVLSTETCSTDRQNATTCQEANKCFGNFESSPIITPPSGHTHYNKSSNDEFQDLTGLPQIEVLKTQPSKNTSQLSNSSQAFNDEHTEQLSVLTNSKHSTNSSNFSLTEKKFYLSITPSNKQTDKSRLKVTPHKEISTMSSTSISSICCSKVNNIEYRFIIVPTPSINENMPISKIEITISVNVLDENSSDNVQKSFVTVKFNVPASKADGISATKIPLSVILQAFSLLEPALKNLLPFILNFNKVGTPTKIKVPTINSTSTSDVKGNSMKFKKTFIAQNDENGTTQTETSSFSNCSTLTDSEVNKGNNEMFLKSLEDMPSTSSGRSFSCQNQSVIFESKLSTTPFPFKLPQSENTNITLVNSFIGPNNISSQTMFSMATSTTRTVYQTSFANGGTSFSNQKIVSTTSSTLIWSTSSHPVKTTSQELIPPSINVTSPLSEEKLPPSSHKDEQNSNQDVFNENLSHCNSKLSYAMVNRDKCETVEYSPKSPIVPPSNDYEETLSEPPTMFSSPTLATSTTERPTQHSNTKFGAVFIDGLDDISSESLPDSEHSVKSPPQFATSTTETVPKNENSNVISLSTGSIEKSTPSSSYPTTNVDSPSVKLHTYNCSPLATSTTGISMGKISNATATSSQKHDQTLSSPLASSTSEEKQPPSVSSLSRLSAIGEIEDSNKRKMENSYPVWLTSSVKPDSTLIEEKTISTSNGNTHLTPVNDQSREIRFNIPMEHHSHEHVKSRKRRPPLNFFGNLQPKVSIAEADSTGTQFSPARDDEIIMNPDCPTKDNISVDIRDTNSKKDLQIEKSIGCVSMEVLKNNAINEKIEKNQIKQTEEYFKSNSEQLNDNKKKSVSKRHKKSKEKTSKKLITEEMCSFSENVILMKVEKKSPEKKSVKNGKKTTVDKLDECESGKQNLNNLKQQQQQQIYKLDSSTEIEHKKQKLKNDKNKINEEKLKPTTSKIDDFHTSIAERVLLARVPLNRVNVDGINLKRQSSKGSTKEKNIKYELPQRTKHQRSNAMILKSCDVLLTPESVRAIASAERKRKSLLYDEQQATAKKKFDNESINFLNNNLSQNTTTIARRNSQLLENGYTMNSANDFINQSMTTTVVGKNSITIIPQQFDTTNKLNTVNEMAMADTSLKSNNLDLDIYIDKILKNKG